ncbi:cell envelope integrity protein TolA [Fangia hongkongensis]|nr:cell envelope integrity protein TolA [Fangia hongkongensis]
MTGVDQKNITIRYLSAIYLGILSACYYYLEFYSLRYRAAGRSSIKQKHITEAINYVFDFVSAQQIFLFAPTRQVIASDNLSPSERAKLQYYGLDDASLDQLHNNFLDNDSLYDVFDYTNVIGFSESIVPIDKGISVNLRQQLCHYVNLNLKLRFCNYDKEANVNRRHKDINKAFVDEFPAPTEYVSLGKTTLYSANLNQSQGDFQTISQMYEGVRYVSGGIGVSSGRIQERDEHNTYGSFGRKYLNKSIESLNDMVGANNRDWRINSTARYVALQKVMLKERLSLQAYHQKKASIEDVLENVEETLMLLIAEVFQNREEKIKKAQSEQREALAQQKREQREQRQAEIEERRRQQEEDQSRKKRIREEKEQRQEDDFLETFGLFEQRDEES